MNRLTVTRLPLGIALAMVIGSATPAFAQEECRGWARSCASVDVRVDGERLMLFTPNGLIELEGEQAVPPTEGSERVTVTPVAEEGEPFGMTSSTASAGATGTPRGPRRCNQDEPAPADDSERKRCGGPTAAIFTVALPASLFILGPGGPDDIAGEGGPTEPVSGPGNSPGADDQGSSAGEGDDTDSAGADGGDSSDSGDSSGTGDSGNNDGGDAAGGDSGSNETTGGSGGNTGNTGGSGGTTGGGSGNNPANTNTGGSGGDGGDTGGDYGPFHPQGNPPGSPSTPFSADLPPISQVPEPISTTLFGLGLAGYAGARIRRRRAELSVEE